MFLGLDSEGPERPNPRPQLAALPPINIATLKYPRAGRLAHFDTQIARKHK
jgi:hypothetical protein